MVIDVLYAVGSRNACDSVGWVGWKFRRWAQGRNGTEAGEGSVVGRKSKEDLISIQVKKGEKRGGSATRRVRRSPQPTGEGGGVCD